MKKIIIAGGSGFIGQALSQYFTKKGYQIGILSRSESKSQNNIQCIQWDGKNLGDWKNELESAYAVINLSGKNINCRHTEKNKKGIINSRVDSTTLIGKAIETLENPPRVWINASGISIYAHSFDEKMTEKNHKIGTDFISEVVQKWEAALFDSNDAKCRKVAMRIGVVLGDEGALAVLKKQTKFGLGGTHGHGKQMIPWVHLNDILAIVEFLIENESIEGPVNACSPDPRSDKEFMKALRKSMKISIGLPAPAFAIKIGAKIIGTEADLILGSIYAFPERLLESGYKFLYPDLESAFAQLNQK